MVGLAVTTMVGLTLVGPASSATAAQLSPVADTYVDASSPGDNYGGSRTLRVEGDPERISYLRYDVGSATSAVLRIASRSNSDDGYEIYAVTTDAWDEATMTWNNRAALGDLVGTTGPTAIDRTYTVDVSAALDGDGLVSVAIVTPDSSSLSLRSRESGAPPLMLAPAPLTPLVFDIEAVSGAPYRATSDLGQIYEGSLKYVVEQAVLDLDAIGGGTVRFSAGDFNLGSEHWELYHMARIVFEGAGMDLTVIRNNSDEASDTEPFDFTVADEITIRNLTINAGGSFRSTSDAIDFDAGNNSVVENVKITGSRGRGIVFDGKNVGWTADNNVVRNCVITEVPADGIELLASRNNLIEGCTVTDTVGHGIQITKASTLAGQPSKTSDDNILRNNVVIDAGQDGINVNSGSRNVIDGNRVKNSADDTAGRDGIRISGNDGIKCDDNVVQLNVSTDDQTPKTQKYGVKISTSLCHRTVLDSNNLEGNLAGPYLDGGTDTAFLSDADTEPPIAPGAVYAVVGAGQVDVSWTPGSDNVGVTEYNVYRNGALLDTVPGSTLAYGDRTALAGQTYTYEVSSLDAASHESGLTAAADVTVPEDVVLTEWEPSADAYVSAAKPTSSYGTSSVLRADGSPLLRTFLRFEVSNASTEPASTVLRLYAESSHSQGIDVRTVSAGGWDESVSFDTAPAVGDVIAGGDGFSAGAYFDIPLGNIVTSDGAYEVALDSRSNTALKLSSREGANPPKLVLLAGANAAPVANAVAVSTDEDVTADWTPDVFDADGDPLTCSIDGQQAEGPATVAADCTSGTYVPEPDTNGSDSFSYTVSDGTAKATATVTVDVAAVADAPVAEDVNATSYTDTAFELTLAATDADGDCPLLFLATDPAHGALSPIGSGSCSNGSASAPVTYTPEAGWTGTDAFTYLARDLGGLEGFAQVQVTLTATPAAFTFQASADTYVNAASPTRNYGSRSAVRVDGSPEVHAYIHFDVSGLPAAPKEVTVRFQAGSNHSTGFELQAAAGPWDESSLTWDTAPGPSGAVLGASGPFSRGDWVEITLPPSLLSGAGPVDLVLTPLTNTALKVDSRESLNPPELVVTTD